MHVSVFANFSPGKRSRGVEVVKQSRLTHEGGPPAHTHTGLTQWSEVNPQSTFWWPSRDRFTAEVLDDNKEKEKTDND